MIRNSRVRTVKPALERLEMRDLPSFLLTGALNNVIQPLQNINKDLNDAASAVKNAFSALTADKSNGATSAQVALDFSAGVSSYQRVLNDQHAIAAEAAGITMFVNAVAATEFLSGDTLDLIVLDFGPIFNIRPLQPLQDLVTSANSTVNSLQSAVTTSWTGLGVPPINLPSIASQVVTPEF